MVHFNMFKKNLQNTVRPLLSAVNGRTKFWSQKLRITRSTDNRLSNNRGLTAFHISWAY